MKDILDLIFEEGNDKPIKLKNEAGKEVRFSQVYATIRDGVAYCILSPLARVRGMGVEEAILFKVNDDHTLSAVAEGEIVSELFREYYSELKKEERRNKKNG